MTALRKVRCGIRSLNKMGEWEYCRKVAVNGTDACTAHSHLADPDFMSGRTAYADHVPTIPAIADHRDEQIGW